MTKKTEQITNTTITATSSDELTPQFEELVRLQAKSSTYKFNAKIKNVRPEELISKKNTPYKAVCLDYMVTSSKNPQWFSRMKPIGTEEARLIIKQGPYEDSEFYEITAEKNEQGYSTWVSIQKLEQ